MSEARNQIRRRAESLADAQTDLMNGLLSLRRKHGLTQVDVAARMGISQSAVAQFERYDANPTLSTIRRYALAVEGQLTLRVDSDREPPTHAEEPFQQENPL